MKAWTDLESTRTVGMAIGPIPWTAQLEWCRFHGLGHHETVIVLSVLRRLEVDRVERESK